MADTNEQLALSWVRKEINKSLDQARQGLEAFAENDSDVTQIRFCISCLHQVRGTLQMLEFYGAALFAEEMEHLAQAICEQKFVAKERALEVLMTSMLQLPSYLDRVQEGRRDLPVILLPLLNELRASRGAAPVSESAIFAPQLLGVEPPEPSGGTKELDPKSFSELAKKCRLHYQKGLLSVMRSQNVKEGIQRMHKVLEKLEEVTSGFSVAHLWWVADGFLFAIIEKGLYKDPAIHALLGKIDRQIKRLADLGADALNDAIPADLLKNLLYFVAKSDSSSEKVDRLKTKFNLHSALPSEAEVEEERRRMRGPDTGAIETVVSAINEDLINVKDTLDLFVRGGDKSTSKIEVLIPNLRKISDTLGILGLGIPRDVIKQQVNTLSKVVENNETVSDALVMDVAGALLFVEANLANVKPADVGLEEENSPEELAAKRDLAASSAQFDDAKVQLLKASRANLQKAKEKIVDFIATSFEFDLINDVPLLLTEIQGGLQIIGFADASELLNKAQDYIERKLIKLRVIPAEPVMDALADIITSVEYCLENFTEIGSTAFDSVLNAAKESQTVLDLELAKPDPVIEIEEKVAEAIDQGDDQPIEHIADETAPSVDTSEVEQRPSAVEVATTKVESPPIYSAPVKAHDESLIDDDVLEIFLEEAEEELASITELTPELKKNTDDEESLTTVRRSFHTLKGSGRLVGASLAGELAWSIENMLNRVIDGSIKLDDKVFDVMRDATEFMPSLIEAFSKNINPVKTPDAIMARAHAISRGETYVSTTPEIETPTADVDGLESSDREPVENTALEEQIENESDEADQEVTLEAFDPADETLELEAFSYDADDQISEQPLEFIDSTDEHKISELDQGSAYEEPTPSETDETLDLVEDIPELMLDDAESEEAFEPVGVDDVLEISESLDGEPISIEPQDDIPLLDVTEEDLPQQEQDLVSEDVDQNEMSFESIDTSVQDNAETENEDDFSTSEFLYDEPLTSDLSLAEQVTYTDIDLHQMDPVLLEIFINEAIGHVQVISETNDDIKNKQVEKASDELLRAMHTLKGSAHMAEVIDIADVSGPLESIIKEYRQRDLRFTEDFKSSLIGAEEFLTKSVEALKKNQFYHSPMKQLLVDELTEQRKQLLQSLIGDSSKPVSLIHRDPELLSIFLAEGMDIVSEAKSLLSQWQHKGSLEAQHNLQAEIHTLKRGANMAMLDEVEQLATALEAFVAKPDQATLDDEYYQLGLNSLDLVLSLLNAAAADQALENPEELIQSLRDWHAKTIIYRAQPGEQAQKESVSETIRPGDVHEAEDEIDEELLEFFLDEADEVIEEIESNLRKWEENLNDLLPVNNLQRNLHTFKGSARMAGVMGGGNVAHALEDLYEQLSSGERQSQPAYVSISYEVLEYLRRMVEQLRDHAGYSPDTNLVERLKAALESPSIDTATNEDTGIESTTPSPQPVTTDEIQTIKLDEDGEEVLEIYLEEGAEILQAMDSALQVWSDDPANNNSIDTLQRSLHTLKGGARLSGLTALGDLTHELETYFEKVADGKIQPNQEQVRFVMRGYDVVHSMLDEVGGSRMLTTPTAYMNELLSVIKGQKLAPTVAASATKTKVKAKVVPITAEAPKEVADDRRNKQQEVVRLASDQLENLVNLSGETSIFRARLEQQVSVLRYTLDEMNQALDRLKDQLRNMEIETDAQIEYRREVAGIDYEEFDPLEFDRYTRQQELTRSLGESTADLSSLKESLDNLASDAETLLLQQGRVNTEMQERLMRTRMVPFESLVPRLRRIVRQIGNELGKAVDLAIVAEGEMDRTVLERMIAPIEHMLRNAMDHGIESPDERKKAGKSETGKVKIRLYRDGSDIFIEISDDGRGLNIKAIRQKAIERGLITEQSELGDHELQQMIFEAGFSTAQKVTQISGRGVGMDVVSSEIKQMGGVAEINSVEGQGATFTVKLPFTVSVNQALMIAVGDDVYAVPLTNIEGIVRVSPYEIQEYYNNPSSRFDYAGMAYHMRYMGNLLDHNVSADLSGVAKPLPVLLLHGAEHPTAVQVDELMGSREIVVKTVGQQLSLLSGLSGATILGDGRVVLILDVPALTRRADAVIDVDVEQVVEEVEDRVPTIMVVDDSITVRKVTQRLLQRHDYEVITAKDGVDALSVLDDKKPDVMLLDIEMPRMDGFELATIIRHDDKLKDLPIIMITSRTGEKHRERAESIGVNRYMGKPYNEVELLQTIESLLPSKVK